MNFVRHGLEFETQKLNKGCLPREDEFLLYDWELMNFVAIGSK